MFISARVNAFHKKTFFHDSMTSQQLGRSKYLTTHRHKELQVFFESDLAIVFKSL